MSGGRLAQPRLGRGLAALLGDVQPNPAAGGTLSVSALEPGPFQPRATIDPAALDALTDSIKRQGVLQPILARPFPGQPGRYQIIAGERRWRAAQGAGLHEIPALVRELTDVEAMAAALVENLQRDDLNAIEEAEGYNRLMREFGLTQEQLSETIGKSRSHVANTLRLLHLPDSVRAYVVDGVLTAGHARAIVGHVDPEGVARTVITRNLTVRQVEALAAQPDARKPARPSAPAEDDPDLQALARTLSEKLGLRVQIAWDGRGGSVRIQYRSLDQLDSLCDRLTAAKERERA